MNKRHKDRVLIRRVNQGIYGAVKPQRLGVKVESDDPAPILRQLQEVRNEALYAAYTALPLEEQRNLARNARIIANIKNMGEVGALELLMCLGVFFMENNIDSGIDVDFSRNYVPKKKNGSKAPAQYAAESMRHEPDVR